MNNKEYNKISKSVTQKYKNNIVPKLAAWEEDRKKAIVKIIISVLVSIIAFFGLSILLSHLFPNENIGAIIFFIVAFLEGLYYYNATAFCREIKKEMLQLTCSCFDDLTWIKDYDNQNANVLEDMFDKSCIFEVRYNSRFYYDDTFQGSHNDTPFEIIELESKSTEGSGKNRHTTTHFKGVIIKVDFNKNFGGITAIKTRSLLQWSPGCALKETKLEDIEFEKKYRVYTTDEVEARYLITTSFMERLKTIKTAFNVNKISCSFYKGVLLIGLHTRKNLFEPVSLFKPMTDSSSFAQTYKEIISIYQMIDHFKLEQKINI